MPHHEPDTTNGSDIAPAFGEPGRVCVGVKRILRTAVGRSAAVVPWRGEGRTGRFSGTHLNDLSGRWESHSCARVTDSLPKRARMAANARAPACRSRPLTVNSSSCRRDGCVLARANLDVLHPGAELAGGKAKLDEAPQERHL